MYSLPETSVLTKEESSLNVAVFSCHFIALKYIQISKHSILIGSHPNLDSCLRPDMKQKNPTFRFGSSLKKRLLKTEEEKIIVAAPAISHTVKFLRKLSENNWEYL